MDRDGILHSTAVDSADRLEGAQRAHVPSVSVLRPMLSAPAWALVQRRSSWLVGGLIGILALLNYLSTLAPTVLGTDAGRFQAKAYYLGVGHPTGYPTFILLGKLFTFLPVGDVAYRVNLSSAVYGAVAVALFFLFVKRLAGTIGALTASVAFALSHTFWEQTAIAEVYTLNVLFICATFVTLLVWRENRRPIYLVLTAFLIGLAMTNHMTSGLLILTAVVFVSLTDWRCLRDWKLSAKALLAFLLGLTPYLYIPIRSAMHPPYNPYEAVDKGVFGLGTLYFIVTGGQFRRLMWAFGLGELPQRFEMYGGFLAQQYHPVVLLVAAFGLLFAARRQWTASIALMVFFLSHLIYALEYNIWDIYVYFIPTYLVIAVWFAFGVQGILRLAQRLRAPWMRMATTCALTAVLLIVVSSRWQTVYAEVDESDNYRARELLDTIAVLPAGSVIYDTAISGLIQYMKFVEGRGMQVEQRGLTQTNLDTLLDQDLKAGRRVYVLNGQRLLSDDYDVQPEAGLFRVTFLGSGAAEWLKANYEGGSILVDPELTPQRMLDPEGRYPLLPHASTALLLGGCLVPRDEAQAQELWWLYHHADGEEAARILDKYDIRYITLLKQPRTDYCKFGDIRYNRYRSHPELYEVVYESEGIIVYRVKPSTGS